MNSHVAPAQVLVEFPGLSVARSIALGLAVAHVGMAKQELNVFISSHAGQHVRLRSANRTPHVSHCIDKTWVPADGHATAAMFASLGMATVMQDRRSRPTAYSLGMCAAAAAPLELLSIRVYPTPACLPACHVPVPAQTSRLAYYRLISTAEGKENVHDTLEEDFAGSRGNISNC